MYFVMAKRMQRCFTTSISLLFMLSDSVFALKWMSSFLVLFEGSLFEDGGAWNHWVTRFFVFGFVNFPLVVARFLLILDRRISSNGERKRAA